MFVRFRQTKTRLQISLVETRRTDGKVRHEHIAALGSIEMPPSVEARMAFWKRLHERLAKLSNRVDAATQAKVLGDVHARIPMVTLDEQRDLKIENAETKERFWSGLRDVHGDQVAGHKSVIAAAECAIAQSEAATAEAAAKVAALKDRVERLKRGEDVPGFDNPVTREELDRILREDGIDPEDCVRMHEVCKAHGFENVMKIIRAERDRAERAVIRAMHRYLTIITDDEHEPPRSSPTRAVSDDHVSAAARANSSPSLATAASSTGSQKPR